MQQYQNKIGSLKSIYKQIDEKNDENQSDLSMDDFIKLCNNKDNQTNESECKESFLQSNISNVSYEKRKKVRLSDNILLLEAQKNAAMQSNSQLRKMQTNTDNLKRKSNFLKQQMKPNVAVEKQKESDKGDKYIRRFQDCLQDKLCVLLNQKDKKGSLSWVKSEQEIKGDLQNEQTKLN